MFLAGIYYDSLTAINGCDSIIVTHLSVNPKYLINRNLSICLGDSLLAGGRYRKTPGIYTDSLFSHFGCDSIIVTNLVVNFPNTTTLNPSLCAGAYYGHHYYLIPGFYSDTLGTYNNIYGCDSVVIAHITVHPIVYLDTYPSICQGDIYHLPNGGIATAGGNYQDTVGVTIHGCDSIIITHLTVFPSFISNFYISVCEGQSYFAQGQFRFTPGNYYDTLYTIHGCDSITVTNLNIIPSDIINRNISICQGDSIYLAGAYRYVSAVYYDSLLSIHSCDSIIITNLSVNNSISNTLNFSLCNGDSLFFGGSYLKTPGTYTDMLHAVFGCDSIVTLHLNFNPVHTTFVTPVICAGSYYGNHFYNLAGNYSDTVNVYNNIYGCDSVVIAHLTVHPAYSVDLYPSVCQGDIYQLPDGNQVTTGGNYSDTLHTINACDSIIVTHLSVYPVFIRSDNVAICQGQSYFAQGQLQYSSGTYYDTLSTFNGCDSIIVTVLTVNTIPGSSGIINGADTVCSGQSGVVYHSSLINMADYYTWQYTGTGAQFSGTADSISVDFNSQATGGILTVTGVNNCGSSITPASFSIHVNPLPEQGTITGPDTLCQGSGQEIYTLSNIGVVDIYNWNYSGYDVVITNNGISALLAIGDSASSGMLSVSGTNICGTGPLAERFITVEVCTGIADNYASNDFIIFPNPNDGSFYIFMNKKYSESLNIRMLNLMGQPVYEKEFNRGDNDKGFYIQLNELPSGIYHVEISDNSGFSSKKVVIHR